MKATLKITKKSIIPMKADSDTIKAPKLLKDRSGKRRLSIYDDFSDENPDSFENNFDDDDVNYL